MGDARILAATVLTLFSRNIPVSVHEVIRFSGPSREMKRPHPSMNLYIGMASSTLHINCVDNGMSHYDSTKRTVYAHTCQWQIKIIKLHEKYVKHEFYNIVYIDINTIKHLFLKRFLVIPCSSNLCPDSQTYWIEILRICPIQYSVQVVQLSSFSEKASACTGIGVKCQLWTNFLIDFFCFSPVVSYPTPWHELMLQRDIIGYARVNPNCSTVSTTIFVQMGKHCWYQWRVLLTTNWWLAGRLQ